MIATVSFHPLLSDNKQRTEHEAERDSIQAFMKLFFGRLGFLVYFNVYHWQAHRSPSELIRLLIESKLAADRESAEAFIDKIATGDEIGKYEMSSFRLVRTVDPHGRVMYRMTLFGPGVDWI